MQNAFIESFNGTFRDDCLNQHWFASLAEETPDRTWRSHDYNRLPSFLHRPRAPRRRCLALLNPQPNTSVILNPVAA
jgi:putative transposase